MKHGLYSQVMRVTLEQRLKEFADLEKAQTAELRTELGTLRALAQHQLEQPTGEFDTESFLKILDRLVRAADVQQRSMRHGMVTLDAVQRYCEALGMVIAKHVKDPDLLRAIEADAATIPIMHPRVQPLTEDGNA